jgi:hypothetical protein
MNQREKLSQCIGTWYSTDQITVTKVVVSLKLVGNSFQVEVFENQNAQWISIHIVLVSYDAVTNQIVAAGQNKDGECFCGERFF